MAPLRILLVDDHSLFRQGIASLLANRQDIELIGQAKNGVEAIAQARQTRPDLILMDIHMPDCDGLTATKIIKQEMPQVHVVMLTASEEDEVLFEAIENGATGYLLKNLEPEELFDMVGQVRQEEAPLSRRMAAKLIERFQPKGCSGEQPETEEELSPREFEVLEKIVEGYTNSEIADRLEITENTVKSHVRRILAKLQAQNRVQAAVQAVQTKLVEAEA
jgi:DNA-binding NarL/FixJ family response regulator